MTPDMIDGKRTEKAVVTVFDKNGNAVNEFSSSDMTLKEFNRTIQEVKARYGLYKCRSFEKKEDAMVFMDKQQEVKHKRVSRTMSD